MMVQNETNAMNAVDAAKANGGRLFTRVAGCADAVQLGWLELLTSTGKVSTGGMGSLNLTTYEKRYGWVCREWRLTDKAPK